MERRTISINGDYEAWVKVDSFCPKCGKQTIWRNDGIDPMRTLLFCAGCEVEYTLKTSWRKGFTERAYKLRKDLSKCKDVNGTTTESEDTVESQ